MSASGNIDRNTFLTHLRQSKLLSRAALDEALNRIPDTDRGRIVARALVEQGVLTKFQAEMLLAGRTSGFVLGQYRILDQLGRGGMGRVFKAEHQTMNRIVALKILAPQLTKTEKARHLFQREVRAAARLTHANIVTAYDANQLNDRFYLVMEYIDGPNLDELIREQGPLPVGQACDFIRQAALGLQYAHENGMVHRDIKPSNLLLQRTPGHTETAGCTVKILDFGLARLHGAEQGTGPGRDSIMTAQNSVMGTPDFMSPEQARDMHQVDIRSDLYSLGCTFYFLLVGRVVFPECTMIEKLLRHATNEPAGIEQLRPEVPKDVIALVRRLIAKNPADRFQTPAELAQVLTPYSVEGPAAWVAPRETGWENVPAAQLGSGGATDGTDQSVLAGTIPTAMSPTPISTNDMPLVQLRRTVDTEAQRRVQIALICAVGIVLLLLVVIGLLAWIPTLF